MRPSQRQGRRRHRDIRSETLRSNWCLHSKQYLQKKCGLCTPAKLLDEEVGWWRLYNLVSPGFSVNLVILSSCVPSFMLTINNDDNNCHDGTSCHTINTAHWRMLCYVCPYAVQCTWHVMLNFMSQIFVVFHVFINVISNHWFGCLAEVLFVSMQWMNGIKLLNTYCTQCAVHKRCTAHCALQVQFCNNIAMTSVTTAASATTVASTLTGKDRHCPSYSSCLQ